MINKATGVTIDELYPPYFDATIVYFDESRFSKRLYLKWRIKNPKPLSYLSNMRLDT